MPYPVNLV